MGIEQSINKMYDILRNVKQNVEDVGPIRDALAGSIQSMQDVQQVRDAACRLEQLASDINDILSPQGAMSNLRRAIPQGQALQEFEQLQEAMEQVWTDARSVSAQLNVASHAREKNS